MRTGFVLTESGRLIDERMFPVLEFIEDDWVPAISPLWGEDVMNGKPQSLEEVENIVKSGKIT